MNLKSIKTIFLNSLAAVESFEPFKIALIQVPFQTKKLTQINLYYVIPQRQI